MGFWSGLGEILGVATSVLGIRQAVQGPKKQDPTVPSWNYFQQRVQAAEQVRQLEWQAKLTGERANLLRNRGSDLLQRSYRLQDLATEGYTRRTRMAEAVFKNVRQGVDQDRKAADLSVTRARTDAVAVRAAGALGIQRAQDSEQAAIAAGDAAIAKSEASIAVAGVKLRQARSEIRLQQAQGNLMRSSAADRQARHLGRMRNLEVGTHTADIDAAQARVGLAGQKVVHASREADYRGRRAARGVEHAGTARDITYERGAATLGLAGERRRGSLDEAYDIEQRQRMQAEDVRQAGRETMQGAREQGVQQGFFEQQANLGRRFLDMQPGVSSYGGDPGRVNRWMEQLGSEPGSQNDVIAMGDKFDPSSFSPGRNVGFESLPSPGSPRQPARGQMQFDTLPSPSSPMDLRGGEVAIDGGDPRQGAIRPRRRRMGGFSEMVTA